MSDSDEEDDLPTLRTVYLSDAPPKKTFEELFKENSNLFESLKGDLHHLEQASVIPAQATLDDDNSIPQDSLLDEEYEDDIFEEPPVQLFGVVNHLQFITWDDLTLIKCGIDSTLNLSEAEQVLITLNEKELHAVIEQCEKFSLNKFKQLKPFIQYVFKSMSLNPEEGYVRACQKLIKRTICMCRHINDFSLSFSDVFKILFNYGVDVEEEIFHILPGAKEIQRSEKINEIPRNWIFNLKAVLSSIADLLKHCKMKEEDLYNIFIYLLWMSIDDFIKLKSTLRQCTATLLRRFSKSEWPGWRFKIAQFVMTKCALKMVLKMIECISSEERRGFELRNYISYLALIKLRDDTLNSNVIPEYSKKLFRVKRLQPILESICSIRKSLQLVAIKFLNLFAKSLQLNFKKEQQKLCVLLKRCENTISKHASIQQSQLCIIHSRINIVTPSESMKQMANQKQKDKIIDEELPCSPHKKFKDDFRTKIDCDSSNVIEDDKIALKIIPQNDIIQEPKAEKDTCLPSLNEQPLCEEKKVASVFAIPVSEKENINLKGILQNHVSKEEINMHIDEPKAERDTCLPSLDEQPFCKEKKVESAHNHVSMVEINIHIDEPKAERDTCLPSLDEHPLCEEKKVTNVFSIPVSEKENINSKSIIDIQKQNDETIHEILPCSLHKQFKDDFQTTNIDCKSSDVAKDDKIALKITVKNEIQCSPEKNLDAKLAVGSQRLNAESAVETELNSENQNYEEREMGSNHFKENPVTPSKTFLIDHLYAKKKQSICASYSKNLKTYSHLLQYEDHCQHKLKHSEIKEDEMVMITKENSNECSNICRTIIDRSESHKSFEQCAETSLLDNFNPPLNINNINSLNLQVNSTGQKHPINIQSEVVSTEHQKTFQRSQSLPCVLTSAVVETPQIERDPKIIKQDGNNSAALFSKSFNIHLHQLKLLKDSVKAVIKSGNPKTLVEATSSSVNHLRASSFKESVGTHLHTSTDAKSGVSAFFNPNTLTTYSSIHRHTKSASNIDLTHSHCTELSNQSQLRIQLDSAQSTSLKNSSLHSLLKNSRDSKNNRSVLINTQCNDKGLSSDIIDSKKVGSENEKIITKITHQSLAINESGALFSSSDKTSTSLSEPLNFLNNNNNTYSKKHESELQASDKKNENFPDILPVLENNSYINIAADISGDSQANDKIHSFPGVIHILPPSTLGAAESSNHGANVFVKKNNSYNNQNLVTILQKNNNGGLQPICALSLTRLDALKEKCHIKTGASELFPPLTIPETKNADEPENVSSRNLSITENLVSSTAPERDFHTSHFYKSENNSKNTIKSLSSEKCMIPRAVLIRTDKARIGQQSKNVSTSDFQKPLPNSSLEKNEILNTSKRDTIRCPLNTKVNAKVNTVVIPFAQSNKTDISKLDNQNKSNVNSFELNTALQKMLLNAENVIKCPAIVKINHSNNKEHKKISMPLRNDNALKNQKWSLNNIKLANKSITGFNLECDKTFIDQQKLNDQLKQVGDTEIQLQPVKLINDPSPKRQHEVSMLHIAQTHQLKNVGNTLQIQPQLVKLINDPSSKRQHEVSISHIAQTHELKHLGNTPQIQPQPVKLINDLTPKRQHEVSISHIVQTHQLKHVGNTPQIQPQPVKLINDPSPKRQHEVSISHIAQTHHLKQVRDTTQIQPQPVKLKNDRCPSPKRKHEVSISHIASKRARLPNSVFLKNSFRNWTRNFLTSSPSIENLRRQNKSEQPVDLLANTSSAVYSSDICDLLMANNIPGVEKGSNSKCVLSNDVESKTNSSVHLSSNSLNYSESSNSRGSSTSSSSETKKSNSQKTQMHVSGLNKDIPSESKDDTEIFEVFVNIKAKAKNNLNNTLPSHTRDERQKDTSNNKMQSNQNSVQTKPSSKTNSYVHLSSDSLNDSESSNSRGSSTSSSSKTKKSNSQKTQMHVSLLNKDISSESKDDIEIFEVFENIKAKAKNNLPSHTRDKRQKDASNNRMQSNQNSVQTNPSQPSSLGYLQLPENGQISLLNLFKNYEQKDQEEPSKLKQKHYLKPSDLNSNSSPTKRPRFIQTSLKTQLHVNTGIPKSSKSQNQDGDDQCSAENESDCVIIESDSDLESIPEIITLD